MGIVDKVGFDVFGDVGVSDWFFACGAAVLEFSEEFCELGLEIGVFVGVFGGGLEFEEELEEFVGCGFDGGAGEEEWAELGVAKETGWVTGAGLGDEIDIEGGVGDGVAHHWWCCGGGALASGGSVGGSIDSRGLVITEKLIFGFNDDSCAVFFFLAGLRVDGDGRGVLLREELEFEQTFTAELVHVITGRPGIEEDGGGTNHTLVIRGKWLQFRKVEGLGGLGGCCSVGFGVGLGGAINILGRWFGRFCVVFRREGAFWIGRSGGWGRGVGNRRRGGGRVEVLGLGSCGFGRFLSFGGLFLLGLGG